MKQIIHIWEQPKIIEHSTLLAWCYKHWTNKDLIPDLENTTDLARKMYEAPFVIVSHGTEPDPVFNYANKKAQELWQLTWEEFICLPSRKSAEPMEENLRNSLIEVGKKKGISFIDKAIRVSKCGHRFYIKNVTLFNLFLPANTFAGQGAIYADWEFL